MTGENYRIADEAINGAEIYLERGTRVMTAWFRLAYAALRILANIADTLAKKDR